MRPFGVVHFAWLIVFFTTAFLGARYCRQNPGPHRVLRFGLAALLALEEGYRYYHDGIHFPDRIPIHLCTFSTWATVIACLWLTPLAMEWSYFVGLAGATVSLITPDLPKKVQAHVFTYESVRYFLEHGGLVVATSVLVFGGIVKLRPGALLRANAMFVTFGLSLLWFNRTYGTNYMYLNHKPRNWTLLDWFGPWPLYLIVAEAIAIAIFWVLWLPVRPRGPGGESKGLEACECSGSHI